MTFLPILSLSTLYKFSCWNLFVVHRYSRLDKICSLTWYNKDAEIAFLMDILREMAYWQVTRQIFKMSCFRELLIDSNERNQTATVLIHKQLFRHLMKWKWMTLTQISVQETLESWDLPGTYIRWQEIHTDWGKQSDQKAFSMMIL